MFNERNAMANFPNSRFAFAMRFDFVTLFRCNDNTDNGWFLFEFITFISPRRLPSKSMTLNLRRAPISARKSIPIRNSRALVRNVPPRIFGKYLSNLQQTCKHRPVKRTFRLWVIDSRTFDGQLMNCYFPSRFIAFKQNSGGSLRRLRHKVISRFVFVVRSPKH